MSPRIPRLGKAVDENHQRAGPHLGDAQIDSIRLHDPHRRLFSSPERPRAGRQGGEGNGTGEHQRAQGRSSVEHRSSPAKQVYFVRGRADSDAYTPIVFRQTDVFFGAGMRASVPRPCIRRGDAAHPVTSHSTPRANAGARRTSAHPKSVECRARRAESSPPFRLDLSQAGRPVRSAPGRWRDS